MKLALEDALALATAWGDKLHGRVSLQAPSHCGWLHPRDEQWITVELQKLARHSVRLESTGAIKELLVDVRETLDVWHAIACCPGYTGAENPVFWRTVVSRAYRRSHQRQRGCSDAHTFFAQLPNNSDFPRFRLCFEDRLSIELTQEGAADEAQHVETVWREFFCLDGHDYAPTDEFIRAMDQLRPFLCQARYKRRVAVGVDLPSWDPRFLYPAVKRLLAETASTNQQRASRFKVEELSFDDTRMLTHDDMLVSFGLWMQLPDVTLANCWWRYRATTDSSILLGAIRAATALDSSYTAKLQTLVVSRQSLTDQQFAGLCIAVAHSTSLRQVRFPMLKTQHDWAWLALAIFHPTHKQGSWRELSVDMATVSAGDLDVMRAARDQGASALLPFIPTEGHSAGEGTSCHVMIGTDLLLDGVTSSRSASSSGMAVAAITTASQADTVCAFVPGRGALWIPRQHAIELRHEQQPTVTAVSCLSVFRCSWFDGSAAVLRDFVCLLGPSLTVVDINENVCVPAVDVEAIARSCPSLSSLSLTHDPSVFTPRPLCDQPSWSSLKSLSVSEVTAQQACDLMGVVALGHRGSLAGLQYLHLAVLAEENSHESTSSNAVLEQVGALLRGNFSLRHVRVEGLSQVREDHDPDALSYEDYRAHVLTTLSIDEQVLDRSNRAKYAFLSALRDRETSVVLPRLTTDTVRMIFTFAGHESANVWLAL